MSSSIRGASVLLTALLLGSSVANAEQQSRASCSEAFRSVDDQADMDIRDADRLIALLEDEARDPAISSGDDALQNRLRERLKEAVRQRESILDKQHDDLNAIRARCDRSVRG